MIERQVVNQRIKEYLIEDYISKNLKNVGHSHTKMMKTPMGEKIVIHASRPGLIVGQKGANIRLLTENIKKEFGLENPQIEINEVENINLVAQIVAERIASSLERFGTQRFKGVGHKVLSDVINAGALGIEIVISGKIPGSRAKSWRFYQGYLKKCGDIAQTGVDTAHSTANLKTGAVGIKVKIMPPDIKLPDNITLIEEKEEIIEEIKEGEEGSKDKKEGEEKEAPAEDKKEEKPAEETKTEEKVEEKKKEAPKKDVKEEKAEAPKEEKVEDKKEEPKAEEKKE